jgi:hypothetical protein
MPTPGRARGHVPRNHGGGRSGRESGVEPSQKNGASDRVRTDDIHLGKVVLYQLSYTRPSQNWQIDIPSFSGNATSYFLK